MSSKNVFVTVGTTKFDKLIEAVTAKDILQTFVKLGYDSITLQIGNGSYEPQDSNIINLSYYRLKSSILDDIRSASLVISHAGAGSCLEILSEHKPLIAVINEDLMGNHQIELAEALAKQNYLCYCTCKDIKKTLLTDLNKLKHSSYPTGQVEKFTNYLDKCVGFQN